jgi:hypothetical protein
VATLVGYTTGLFYGSIIRVLSTGSLHGFSLRVLSTGSLFGLFFGLFLGTTVLIILSIYMGPVDPQVDYHQAIQSILCCAYITTIIVIFIKWALCPSFLGIQSIFNPNSSYRNMKFWSPDMLRCNKAGLYRSVSMFRIGVFKRDGGNILTLNC